MSATTTTRKGSGAVSEYERLLGQKSQQTKLPCPGCPTPKACTAAGVCRKRVGKSM